MGLSKELKDNMSEGTVPVTEPPAPAEVPATDPLPVEETPVVVFPEEAPVIEVCPPCEHNDAPAVDALSVWEALARIETHLTMAPSDGADVAAALARIEARLSASQPTQSGGDLAERLAALEAQVAAVTEKQDRNDRQLTQDLRENANFRIQVRQGMQSELDDLREQQRGEQFNPLLKELAALYADYYFLLSDDLSPVTKKNLSAMFDQLSELMAEYGVEVLISKEGEPRQNRLCKVASTIPVGDESLHNTIAHSRKPGLVRDRLVLCQEFADVYVYDPALKPAEPEQEPAETPAEEADEQPAEAPVPETTGDEQ